MMYKHICSQMNVAIAAMIAGCLRHRRRDHAVTRIHDTTITDTDARPTTVRTARATTRRRRPFTDGNSAFEPIYLSDDACES